MSGWKRNNRSFVNWSVLESISAIISHPNPMPESNSPTGRNSNGRRKGRPRPIVVPTQTPRRFYGHGIPGVQLEKLTGKLIVVEGADGSGRSTQIRQLVEWLEGS